MTFQYLNCKITGVAPILFNNGQMADPMNRFAKALKQVSSKRAKTDADFIEMQRIEWYGSLYVQDGKLILPAEGLEAAFINGAKKSKLGKTAQAGLFVTENARLQFDGDDLTVDELFERDQNRLTCGVKMNGKSRVMKTRFKAKDWSAILKICYEDSLLNAQQVKDAIYVCGEQIGIFDWRPKHGRYVVEFID